LGADEIQGMPTAIWFRIFLSLCSLSENVKIKIYRILIVHVILFGFQTSSFSVREEYRLKVLESWVQREIFGLKTQTVRGGWRKVRA
jgi:hypothetical protein